NIQRKKRGEELYANPRNLAAGSIRQLDSKLAAARPLKFMAYDLVSDVGQKTHEEDHRILSLLGFKTDSTARVCRNQKEVLSYWKEMEKKRDSLPFHIDGVVVAVNDNAVFQALGVAGKSPRAIRALKFTGKQGSTKIVDVKFQVGRTGAVTPVAQLEPIQLAGVTISHATLHNADEIKRLKVKIGDTVVVERAGDVIPAVIKALPELRNGSEKAIKMPIYCPVCGVKLVRPEGEVVWRCPNKGCLAQKQENLYHFVSKKAFNIVGLGPKIIDKLVDEHLLSEPSDIFKLTKDDLMPLEKFAEKAAKNTVSAIKEAKDVSLARFIYALGIRHVGEETAIDLANHFLSLSRLKNIDKKELEKMPDVGEVVAQSISDWFKNRANQELVKKLLRVGVRIQNPKPSVDDKAGLISGKTFVLTGTLFSLTRDEAKEKIRWFGGVVSESVSKNTDYVIVGVNPGSKLKDAQKLGIKTLNEKHFLKFLP
ncbi:NAD-dependent DNA ligase LigA, partial [Patescibacteria group bacterium]|nr:NAD-dependent DNA ligase LigA [Patescibacteria group bacterium]